MQLHVVSLFLNARRVLIQDLHPSKDPVSVVFEGESFGETLLTWSAVVKLDGLAFGAFPGCVTRCFTLTSRFLMPRPRKSTIYTMQCRHFLSFSLRFCEATQDRSGASSINREKKEHLEEPSKWNSLRVT